LWQASKGDIAVIDSAQDQVTSVTLCHTSQNPIKYVTLWN